MSARLPLAVTMGETAGIGGELTLMAWQALHAGGPLFVAIDNAERLSALAGRLGLGRCLPGPAPGRPGGGLPL